MSAMPDPAEVVPPAAFRLSAVVLVTLLCAALAWGLVGVGRALPTVRALPAAFWLDGRASRVLEKMQELPANSTLHSLNAGVQYRLFGELGPQVSEGCPGWLFYGDGLSLAAGVDPDFVFAQRLRLMRYYTARLRQLGVPLLVVTVPDKSRIETGGLCGLRQAPVLAAQLARWQTALQQQGVPYVALQSALDAARPAYFRTDVHWNQHGALAAAQAVAQVARPMLGGAGPQQYLREVGSAVLPRMGDLIVLAGLEHAPRALRPALDLEQPETIRAVHGGTLLDEPAPPEILLAGSSNSRRSNFEQQLGALLGREMWNRSLDGGNFSDALRAALDDHAAWPHGLKLVVWEMSEMSLSLPLSPAEQAYLAHDTMP